MPRLWEQDTYEYKGFTIHNHDGPPLARDDRERPYEVYAVGWFELTDEEGVSSLEGDILAKCFVTSKGEDIHVTWKVKPCATEDTEWEGRTKCMGYFAAERASDYLPPILNQEVA